MIPQDHRNGELASIRHSIRLVILMEAAENAGAAPIRILHLHTLAYLSNVLAPVWDMPALEGKVLKRHGGPFYPMLQRDLDSLVGRGVALISGLDHVRDEDKRWRLEGSYRLNRVFADPILDGLLRFAEEQRLVSFIRELALAISALSDDDLHDTTKEDATYSDPLIAIGNVVDFGEWRMKNYTANAANKFDQLLPGGDRATRGEKLHLYVRHLQARMHGGT
jgi:hypothetical protein